MTYNINGRLIFTAVPGTSYTGLYNVNGSYNVVLTTENTTYKGAYHPCGALWGTSYSGASQANYQAIDGSVNISSNGDGTYSPIYPLGGAGNVTPPPAANANLMLQFNVASAFISYFIGAF